MYSVQVCCSFCNKIFSIWMSNNFHFNILNPKICYCSPPVKDCLMYSDGNNSTERSICSSYPSVLTLVYRQVPLHQKKGILINSMTPPPSLCLCVLPQSHRGPESRASSQTKHSGRRKCSIIPASSPTNLACPKTGRPFALANCTLQWVCATLAVSPLTGCASLNQEKKKKGARFDWEYTFEAHQSKVRGRVMII